MGKWSEQNAADDFIACLNHSQTSRIGIIHQPRDVLSRHLWELFLKQDFESGEKDEGTRLTVVFDSGDVNEALSKFLDGDFFWLMPRLREN